VRFAQVFDHAFALPGRHFVVRDGAGVIHARRPQQLEARMRIARLQLPRGFHVLAHALVPEQPPDQHEHEVGARGERRERELVEVHAFAVQQPRTLGMHEQLAFDERRLIVAIQEPHLARKAEREAVEPACNLRGAALLDEHVAKPRRHGHRRHARQLRRD
jgi:hypothetical protein